jgi:hypothetical protein
MELLLELFPWLLLLVVSVSIVIIFYKDDEKIEVVSEIVPKVHDTAEKNRLLRNRVYFAWCFLHLVLFLSSNTFKCFYYTFKGDDTCVLYRVPTEFFPFTSWILEYPDSILNGAEKSFWGVMKITYDFFELVVYTMTPLLFYYLWRKRVI